MRFRAIALTVIVFAVAMAYLESACVVYLQRALSIDPDRLFPLRSRRRRRQTSWRSKSVASSRRS